MVTEGDLPAEGAKAPFRRLGKNPLCAAAYLGKRRYESKTAEHGLRGTWDFLKPEFLNSPHPLVAGFCQGFAFQAVLRANILFGLEAAAPTPAQLERFDVSQRTGLRKTPHVATTFADRARTKQSVYRPGKGGAQALAPIRLHPWRLPLSCPFLPRVGKNPLCLAAYLGTHRKAGRG